MPSNRSQPISQIQLPHCPICNLQPIPESVQFIPFIMIEVFLAFVSIKLALIFVLCSYCYSRSAWFCPQCKREIEIYQEVEGVSENLIIRMGNCMFMLSKFKFRVIAIAICAYLFYLYALQIHNRPKLNIEKTWVSLASNCGYEVFIQNSFKANSMYAEYPQLGEWTIAGIYLREEKVGSIKKYYIKMNPTQFKNALTEDIVVIVTSHTEEVDKVVEIGDVIEFKGQWEGREGEGHLFRFIATKIHKIGTRFSPTDVKLLSVAEKFIRTHESQVLITQQQHQRLVNAKISNLTKDN